MSAVRVVVVEDERMIRDAFAQLLDLQPDVEVVGRAADGPAGAGRGAPCSAPPRRGGGGGPARPTAGPGSSWSAGSSRRSW